MVYLLDTNIVSDLVRNPHGTAAIRLVEAESEAGTLIVTSIVVACEARFGILRKGSPRLEERVEGVLSRLSILPLTRGRTGTMPGFGSNWNGKARRLARMTC